MQTCLTPSMWSRRDTASFLRRWMPVWFGAFLMILWLNPSAQAQMGVSPSRFELSLDPLPGTQSVRVFNFGQVPAQVEVSIVNWELDTSNQLQIIPPTEQSLDQWLIVSPLRFTIPPGVSQTVRFAIRPKVRPLTGEHRAMLFFEQRGGEEQAKGIQVLYRVGATIYGHVGDVSRTARLLNMAATAQFGTFDVSSEGTAHVRFKGRYAIWKSSTYPGLDTTPPAEVIDQEAQADWLEVGALPSTPVLPGTKRQLRLPFEQKLSAGRYILEVKGTLGDAEIQRILPFAVQVKDLITVQE